MIDRIESKTILGCDRQGGKVSFSATELGNHTHVIGSTGTGKSRFLELLIRQDIEQRQTGICLIDPHGSLYNAVLEYIASEQSPRLAERVILFNPAGESDQIVGFNPIPNVQRLSYAVDTLVAACFKAWGQNSDSYPRITQWLNNIFYLLIVNKLTLLEAAPFFDVSANGKEARRKLLEKIGNQFILQKWQKFEQSSPSRRDEFLEGAENRLRKFLTDEIIRAIIGQKEHTLNFEQIMEQGQILLVNLDSRAVISQDVTKFLGIMMINEIYRVTKLRDCKNQHQLKPFHVYIDEFGQYVSHDIAASLDEFRKFKVSMILAHQHLAQLRNEDDKSRKLYDSVLTNCKNKVVFGGLSYEDTEIMTKEIMTGFLDLKEIKDEVYQEKQRMHEERRQSVTASVSAQQLQGENWQTARGETHTDMQSSAEQQGKTVSHTTGRGTQRGTSATSGAQTGYNQQGGTNYHYNPATMTYDFTTMGGHSSQQSTSNQTGRSEGCSEQESDGEAHQRSQTTAQATADAVMNSESNGESKAVGQGISLGMSESPFLKPEAYTELSKRTYYSQAEQLDKAIATIKNQDTGLAFVRTNKRSPTQIEIEHVAEMQDLHTPEFIEKYTAQFSQKVFAKHPDCYTPLQEAKQEYERRQIELLGEPLRFDENEALGSLVLNSAAKELPPTESENPFE